jgi:hypothetical protein
VLSDGQTPPLAPFTRGGCHSLVDGPLDAWRFPSRIVKSATPEIPWRPTPESYRIAAKSLPEDVGNKPLSASPRSLEYLSRGETSSFD